jgi:hypothetical protein
LPPQWEAIIEGGVPYLGRLPSDKQYDLGALVQVFVDEKPFEGCGGLEIDDRIRLTIAGYACILLLGGQSDLYPKLRTILVYPHAYWAPCSDRRPDGTVSEGLQPRAGESWTFGNIVLSWEDVCRDASHPGRGRNVVLHEFAHQLDAETGSARGAPILPAAAKYADWARVFGREYEALLSSVEQDKPTLLDSYGAASPAEFFAVATECFFLKPLDLRARHRELYDQLEMYYRQNPAKYFE